ncbi:MAG: glutamyl-tRNA reductase [Gammaproteobacteria bacterium]|nr:glutamyl-tRNA reductase [Gammaproteobacteria bacterium]
MSSKTPSLITLGINHKTTPLKLRERLAFTPQTLLEALSSLHKLKDVEEAAIISTCNRTELYCAMSKDADQSIIDWFSSYHGLESSTIKSHLYTYNHNETIRHAMSVTCGLDSMVLGEPQIAGQMKEAYSMARQQGTLGRLLGKLFQHSFAVAKQVRTDTAIGSSPVSVAFAAVSLAKQIFGELNQSTALLIGAGETIELTARHLHSQKIKHMIIANRSLERAENLAEEFNAEAIRLPQIAEHLHRADIVIASTASPLPVLGKGTVERALKIRKRQPIFMVDLAVPRDIEAEVASLDDVYLYAVDDLQDVIDENLQSRQQAAEQAHDIIDEEVHHFLNWQRSLDSVDLISELRSSTRSMSQEVLNKALKQVAAGESPEKALEFLAHTLTNKFLHRPCTSIRKACEENNRELINAAKQLLINSDDDESRNK